MFQLKECVKYSAFFRLNSTAYCITVRISTTLTNYNSKMLLSGFCLCAEQINTIINRSHATVKQTLGGNSAPRGRKVYRVAS